MDSHYAIICHFVFSMSFIINDVLLFTGMYYAYNLMLIISSIFVSTCIVNIYKLGELRRQVPRWVQAVSFTVTSSIFYGGKWIIYLEDDVVLFFMSLVNNK